MTIKIDLFGSCYDSNLKLKLSVKKVDIVSKVLDSKRVEN